MITKLSSFDRSGNPFEFIVNQEPNIVNGISGITYKISTPEMGPYKYFEIQTLNVSPHRIMMFMLLNHFQPEVTGKGIVKAMIKALSKEFKVDIVSSTRIEDLKVSISEGRIDEMTNAWKKWAEEFSNIEYLKHEDRFIFRYVP